jgi:hypothetical protein
MNLRKESYHKALDTTRRHGSLDLSNQEDVGEREAAALAALDRLYTQNADGMKRLADS